LPGASLFHTVDGPADAPVLVLSNSLGCDADLWSLQVPQLVRDFRVLRYDTRGHGRSGVASAPFTFRDLAGDVVGLLDHLGIACAHFCGISMGGLTGMALALQHPQRVDRLVLANTAARIGSVDSWSARIEAVRQNGLEAMAPQLVTRWLSPGFFEREPGMAQLLVDRLRRLSDDGYIGSCEALRDEDLRAQVSAIASPTLVIAGHHDAATTVAQAHELQQSIAGAQCVELDASHLSNWEQPQAFTEQLLRFLRA